MKITNPEALQQVQPEKTQLKKGPAGSTSFDNFLKKALENPDLNRDVERLPSLPEPRFIQSFGNASFQTDFTDKTSRAIDLMDSYAKSLSNPKKTLKDIELELMAFIEEAERLNEEYTASGNSSAELKNILEKLLNTARLESVRFNRGDYLDSE